MPGGNGTGPMGMGSMTGRAAGFCAGFETAGYANAAPGRGGGAGFGRGRGFSGGGRGRRNMFYATGQPGWMRTGGDAVPYGYPASRQSAEPETERRALMSQVDTLQSELMRVTKRLEALETKKSGS